MAIDAEAEAKLRQELGDVLAEQFLSLFGGSTVEMASFKTAAYGYFDACSTSGTNPDPYFNWIGVVALPRLETPLLYTGLWEFALSVARDWEADRGKHQHKGSGYYFAGMRDIALGDLDRGFLYMHQAAVEDTYPDRDRLPDSPAGWFVSLDSRRADQAYGQKVKEYEDYLESMLAEYRREGRGGLTLTDLRTRYQAHGELTDAVTTVAHTIARLVQANGSATRQILDNRFAALVLTQIALELCLVIEDLLQDQIGSGRTLGALISRYPQGHSVGFTVTEVGDFNRLAHNSGDFDAVIAELLTGVTVTGFARALTPREADLAIVLLVRNKSAHGLDRPGAASMLFDQIVPRLFFGLFAVIESLYP